ncbi:hypothetical protein RFI_07972 [Reticulomyxa filosa]|uniref:Uncharacterized protein n=1 Tax=Reticulomyxa filosa TaxID=46433 RepID=X6NTQ6_RETFI|nr:hypothetical protein RFI_07972 [Reticulomyxa filosa]|eukprot:ETO29154.1 hypothetical protein RFI_07972 [Reticulomyxa filosa]
MTYHPTKEEASDESCLCVRTCEATRMSTQIQRLQNPEKTTTESKAKPSSLSQVIKKSKTTSVTTQFVAFRDSSCNESESEMSTKKKVNATQATKISHESAFSFSNAVIAILSTPVSMKITTSTEKERHCNASGKDLTNKPPAQNGQLNQIKRNVYMLFFNKSYFFKK